AGSSGSSHRSMYDASRPLSARSLAMQIRPFAVVGKITPVDAGAAPVAPTQVADIRELDQLGPADIVHSQQDQLARLLAQGRKLRSATTRTRRPAMCSMPACAHATSVLRAECSP